MIGAPRSEIFNDVYFSAENGLAEAQHVFLQGNNLPTAWADRAQFTIAESGFGTGLNFLAAWDLFVRTTGPGQSLHFISYEMYPLDADRMRAALAPWQDIFANRLEALLEAYQPQSYEHLFDNIRLTLIIGDINDTLPNLNQMVDCWFLDGFKPSANPQMWTQTVFENMARCSAAGATFATFTAAGFVRRGLQKVGFDVRKVKGFGTKREMLCGTRL
ncbi:MAG: tRNA (5-methylaminomethyl-2-thiouridine)(34)-methyltransferase MnmD [Alphaproteobacteria bacterium]|nr:tRNA (5-methylaminomethyl-2-thiouridine)(34)-methyltransferase MnmD [Alphaproteobacteria bacterium]